MSGSVRGVAVQAESLSRRFGDITAVDGLSLEVPEGVVFGFLGPNGSGKTTTINLLLGLLEPSEGTAHVLGFDVRTEAQRIREVSGALLEHPGVYEHMNADENLEFYGRAWRMPAAERVARIRELLGGMGLWDRRKDRVGTWSRGMQQKLAIARALLHRPRLVFLDEPTAGLDVPSAADVRDHLEHLVADEGVTVFLTTHNMVEAERLCSRVAVVRRGRLLAVGSPSDLRSRAAAPAIRITGTGLDESVAARLEGQPGVQGIEAHGNALTLLVSPDMDTSALLAAVLEAGGRVDEVRRDAASLEDVFLALIEEEES